MITRSSPARYREPATVALDGCCFVGSRTGIANYVSALLEPLCAQHPEVRFLLYSNDLGDFCKAPNLEVRVSSPRRRGPIWHNTQVVDMLREDAVDLFWGTNGLIPLRGLGRTATVVTIHDLVHAFAPQTQELGKRWKQRVFQPLCTRAADRVIAVSQATADDVARHYGRVPESIVHPLVSGRLGSDDAAAVDDALQRLRLPERFILTVGTLEPRKNIAALVAAHVACRAAGHDLPPLVVVGGQGWRDGNVRRALDDTAAPGRVHCLGFLPNRELRHLYARCHAFVMPSIYEGFGMPLLEAQLCGAPVLHGNHRSMTEAAGGLGVAFEPSADGLLDMLTRLAEHRAPLVCRLPADIENDAERSARRLWQVMVDAWQARQVGVARVPRRHVVPRPADVGRVPH